LVSIRKRWLSRYMIDLAIQRFWTRVFPNYRENPRL